MSARKVPFLTEDTNLKAYDALSGLVHSSQYVKLNIMGQRGSGKTTLMADVVEEINNASPERAFLCTGADLSIAVSIHENDYLLQKVGEVEVLFIDDIGLLFKDRIGDQIFSYLIEHRDEQKLTTVVSSESPSEKITESFQTIEISPLSDEGKVRLVKSAAQTFKTAESPALNEDAFAYIALEEFPESADAVFFTQFIMTGGKFSSGEVITRKTIKELIAERS